MGEAPVLFGDDLQGSISNGYHLKLKEYESAIVVGNKTYVIGEFDDPVSNGVRVFDKSTSEW
ncbi:hypothetical protein M8C21_024782 [Ambrosia artemisiifolia]|uniref:Uncharacterized protein n=1 Tax=Ambrosia artemisiifolia TaxID=4212 RepID=A0AAD5G2Z9_AMBAR|nr:hypothetical protein M8C21_024782 [Ambrosia artemisiifolia]